MFRNEKILILNAGVGKARLRALESQLAKNGARVASNFDSDVSLILVDPDLSADRLRSLLPPSSCVKVLSLAWLTHCLKEERYVEEYTEFEIQIPAEVSKPELPEEADEVAVEAPIASTTAIPKAENAAEGENEGGGRNVLEKTIPSSGGGGPSAKRGRFVCETPSDEHAERLANQNFNRHITEKLQVLADGYKSTNDKWRALSYEKAIKTIQRHPKKITSQDEIRGLRTIGARLAEKVWEICQSGELRKADEFSSSEKVQAMNIFTNIWGVGPAIAEQWFVQGLRSLEDVEEKGHLTRQQKIGLKYYHEFLDRMPRAEASEIVDFVVKTVGQLNGGLICEACGSYRRLKATCGDVDILITHPDGYSQLPVLGKLVKILTDQNFLTDDLVQCQEDQTHRKYMGVCRLPGDKRLHRRIDIITVPYDEYATSLIYFTGSAHFTRSIYAKAKSMGMRLNQHGLRGGIMRQHGETLNAGFPVETPTEESVFDALGIAYRTPAERDHV